MILNILVRSWLQVQNRPCVYLLEGIMLGLKKNNTTMLCITSNKQANDSEIYDGFTVVLLEIVLEMER